MTRTDQLTQRLQEQIYNEPLIRDPSRINVSMEREGSLFNRRDYIVVNGRVSNEVEYEKVDKIVSQESQDVEVVNNLKIESSLI